MSSMNRSGGQRRNPVRGSDPYKWASVAVFAVVVLTIPAILGIVKFSMTVPQPNPMQEAAESFGLDVETYSTGRELFTSVCVLCHGSRGQGVPLLGKPLRNSEFVQMSTDDDLIALIANGRLPDDPANSSGNLMPARGANPAAVTDDKIPALVKYLRTMQDSGAPYADASAWVVSLEERAAAAAAAEEVAASSGITLSGAGYDAYVAGCSACHGPQGEGMEGLGKPFTTSAFVRSKTNAELVSFVKVGRPIWDAENTTGIDMPSKGGNPALNDEQLLQIIEFIRSVNDSGSE